MSRFIDSPLSILEPGTFLNTEEMQREVSEAHQEALDRFEAGLPELDTYITSIRRQIIEEDQGFNEEELGYEATRLALADRILRNKQMQALAHPVGTYELIAYVVEVHRGIFGFGPLTELMEDQDVTDIMVHRFDRISVARRSTGRDILLVPNCSFASEDALRTLMQNIMSANKKTINPLNPIADGVMPGSGARVLAVDAAIAEGGMVVIIRKPSLRAFTPQDLLKRRSFTPEVGEFLRLSVRCEANMVVVGATGSGKTALLSALMHHIPRNAHTVTIEDTIEIQVPEDYKIVTQYKTRINAEDESDKANRTIYDLLRASLRSNPTYIFVGETRGKEAWEMLQAMKSGHAGITTIHAGDGPDALTRLEGMMSMMGGVGNMDYLRRDIATVMDLFIIQGWVGLGDRRRRGIQAIYEIVPTRHREDLTFDDVVPASTMITAEDLLANNPQYVRVLGDATLRTLYTFDLDQDQLVPGVRPSPALLGRFRDHGLLDDYLKISNL